ncbi:hypothetical protein N7453_010572 [Penicillium expansum]|nr:hypothetical protein N7453_010572 [Penicillium expansum]
MALYWVKITPKSSKQRLVMSRSIAGSNRRWRLWPMPRPSEVTTLRSSCSSHLSHGPHHWHPSPIHSLISCFYFDF